MPVKIKQDSARKVIARLPRTHLKSGQHCLVEYPPYHVLLARLGEDYHAIEDGCPHSGYRLSLGELKGQCITCPGHGWEINVTTGRVVVPLGMADRCQRYHIEVDDETITIYDETL